MSLPVTRSQRLAQSAFQCVNNRVGDSETEYSRFSKRLPSLIHTCGLVQAIAFAIAKKRSDLIDDLASVLELASRDDLARKSRESEIADYIRLSRLALEAAGWLKRYSEAVLKGDDERAI